MPSSRQSWLQSIGISFRNKTSYKNYTAVSHRSKCDCKDDPTAPHQTIVETCRLYLSQFVQVLTILYRNGIGGPSAQLPHQSIPGNQTQAGWPPQSGPSQGVGFLNPQMGQNRPSLGQSQGQNMQAALSQLQPNSMINQKQLPRSGPTPQQLLPNTAQISPDMSNRLPVSNGPSDISQSASNMLGTTVFPPPLSKAQFDGAYRQWCTNRGMAHDPRLMSVDSRPIDLYALHFQVITEGGAAKVGLLVFFFTLSYMQNIVSGYSK
jgi:hypothetical protein